VFERAIRGARAKRVVVFVPGFATSVQLGYTAAARIQETLGADDKVVLIDWGSEGKLTGYERDARTAHRNAPELNTALRVIKSAAAGGEVDVFAHSLGTRVVANAIAALNGQSSLLVTRVVLAAPDMTIADYQRAIARVPGPVGRVTIYASSKDRALFLSEIIHLHRRLGLITHWRRALANTDVVDASVASDRRDGHGYAINEPELISDIGDTLAGMKTPHLDWKTKRSGAADSWVFAPRSSSALFAPPLDPCVGAR
jgi:esterase/lipase superfamily enzyme